MFCSNSSRYQNLFKLKMPNLFCRVFGFSLKILHFLHQPNFQLQLREKFEFPICNSLPNFARKKKSHTLCLPQNRKLYDKTYFNFFI